MKLLVIGSSNTDMVVKTDTMPIPGETVMGGKFSMNFGGKGANQAVCAAKLGMETGFLTKLGNDVFGANTLKYFNELGLNTSKIELKDNVASGVALITVDKTGENSIVVASGANDLLSPEDIENAKDFIKEYVGILLQCEIPIETVLKSIEIGKELGKLIVLNPAPVKNIPDEYFKMVDIIMPNTNESRQLLGLAPDDDTLSPSELASKLIEKGVKNVVITLGTKGSYIKGEEGEFQVNAYKVKALDTTGAGDSYCASLTCAYLKGKSLKEASDFASRVSAIAVTRMGAQTTPSLEEVLSYKF